MNEPKKTSKLEAALAAHIDDLRSEIETLDREAAAIETKREAVSDERNMLLDILSKNGGLN